jgi:hypothetical protein
MPSIGVLGTFVWDRIWYPGRGEPLEQWGGIAYSLAAWSAARPDGWRIHPILRVGADLASEANRFLGSLPNIDQDVALDVVSEPNNRVDLHYHDSAERTEELRGGVSGWSWGALAPRLDGLRALYVNFISGFEMDLPTAERLGSVGIDLYADLHSLFLGPPGDGPRKPRRREDGGQWLRCFDVVQVNENEALLLGGLDAPDGEDRSHPREASLLVVTQGGRGAGFTRLPGRPGSSFGARLSTAPASGWVPVSEVARSGDPTGCGDVWGSVFFAGLLERRPVAEAMARAHAAAAAKLGEPDITRLEGAIRASLAGFDSAAPL